MARRHTTVAKAKRQGKGGREGREGKEGKGREGKLRVKHSN